MLVLALAQDYLEEKPGRKRMRLGQGDTGEQDEDKDTRRQRLKEDRKAWKGERTTVDTSILPFVVKHTKTMLRYIEATY